MSQPLKPRGLGRGLSALLLSFFGLLDFYDDAKNANEDPENARVGKDELDLLGEPGSDPEQGGSED